MTSSASREMTEQEMINTSTAPQMAHLIQVLRQTIRNKDKEIEKWVDMVKQLQRDGELDPPEPKPLLADAKAGDLCMLRNGGYTQIDSVKRLGGKTWYDRTDRYTSYPDGRLFKGENNESDIIATEPLAEVGSAEWAWQMLMLQKPVSHPAEGEFQDTYPIYTKEGFIRCMAKTGWQLYEEPKPEPQYKVRDWVEFNPGNNPKQVEIVQIDGDKLYYNTMYAGKTIKTHIYASAITRKLDPSEVIVHIGCLSGMVSQCGDKEEEVFALHTKNNAAVIPFAMLDAPTRELVEGLLKAQEEKCHS